MGKSNNRLGRRQYLRTAGALSTIGAAAFAGCTGDGGDTGDNGGTVTDGDVDAKNPATIGVLGPLEHHMGVAEIRNVRLAAEEINANGGINGRQIEIESRTTDLDADTSTTNFRRLVQNDGVDVVFGGFSDGVIQTTMNTMAELEMLWLGDGASPQTLMPIVDNYDQFKFFFRIDMANSAKFPQDHLLMMQYFREEKDLAIDRIAVIRDDAVYTEPFMEALRGLYSEVGIEIVMDEPVPVGVSGSEMSSLLSKADSAGADAVSPILAIASVMPLVETWAQSQPTMLLAGQGLAAVAPNAWNKSNGSVEHACLVADGGTAMAPITDKMIPFMNKYQKRYDELPGAHIAPDFYDGVFMYKRAVEAAASEGEDDPLDPATLVPYLEAIGTENPFPGVQGQKAFTDMHQLKWGTDYIRCWPLQWRGPDDQVVFAPEERATGEMELPPWIEPSDFN